MKKKGQPNPHPVVDASHGTTSHAAGIDIDALMGQILLEAAQRPSLADGTPDMQIDPSSPLSAEEIMERVRAEVARRGPASQSVSGISATGAKFLPRWQPAAPRLPDKPQYALGDFLQFDDADFVDVAYQKLLRRPADPPGLRDYLNALRGGLVSKVEILGLIRFSGEGRQQNVHVDGLLVPFKLHQWRRLPWVGHLLGFAIAVLRLPRLAWRLQGMEASAAREAHAIGHLLDRVDTAVERRFEDIEGVISALRAEVSQHDAGLADVDGAVHVLRAEVSQHDAQHLTVQERLAAQEAAIARVGETQREEIDDRLARYDVALATLNEQARNGEVVLAALNEQARNGQRSLRNMLERLTVFLDVSARQSRGGEVESTDKPALESQNASFEDTFRGEPERIKQCMAHYLGTLKNADIQPGAGTILDLGSGRGEWLDVLVGHGYDCRGVDLNRSMLKASEARGHEMVEADALDYLRAQDDGSFAAISAMHLVEHIPHPTLIKLLDEALRSLRPGGVLILETPNPENVLVGSCMFYMDPTHLNPIPPALLQWTVQARGFEQVTIERLSEHRPMLNLPPVPENVPGAEQINQMTSWFSAPPDYAVVARKP